MGKLWTQRETRIEVTVDVFNIEKYHHTTHRDDLSFVEFNEFLSGINGCPKEEIIYLLDRDGVCHWATDERGGYRSRTTVRLMENSINNDGE